VTRQSSTTIKDGGLDRLANPQSSLTPSPPDSSGFGLDDIKLRSGELIQVRPNVAQRSDRAGK
jgi:hypothetical protein